MRIRKISCSLGRTVNMGHFESLRADATFDALLEEHDDVQECWESLVIVTRRYMNKLVEEERKELEG